LANSSDSQASDSPLLCCGRWQADGLSLNTRVSTRCRRLELGRVENGRLKLRLTAPPVDGKANQQARQLLAKAFGVGVSNVELLSGQSHKNKRFLIRSPSRFPAQVIKI
jgi:uncharacterized protein (TIGR00251 family)